jgi:hypothetical protein
VAKPEKHPHIEQPTEAQLVEVLADKADAIRQLYLEVHRLVVKTLPDVRFAVDCKDGMTGYGARQYGYDGWGMGALAAHTNWVSLAFMRGADLPDPAGLLEGTGKKVRHVKVRSAEQLAERREALVALIEAAAGLNAG